LTEDIIPHPRRTRRLSLDELVAGALILYPRYFDYQGGIQIPVEQAIEHLQALRAQYVNRSPWWRPIYRMILRRVVGVR
jgi:capsular polysaccharide export protein